MTLAAPRSRQGKLLLGLAFLAATVAAVGALLWSASAEATLDPGSSGTTVTVTDSVAGAGPVAQGDIITYTVTIVAGTITEDNDDPYFEMDADPNLLPVSITAGANLDTCVDNVTGYSNVKCSEDADQASASNDGGPLANNTITIQFLVLAAQGYPNVGNPTYCQVYDDGSPGGEDCVFTDLAHDLTAPAGDPATAVNPPGQDHSIDFALPAGFTCESDQDENDGLRACDLSDVLAPGVTLVSGPTVSDTNLGNPATVNVVINSAVQGTFTVELLVHFDPETGTPANPCVDCIDTTNPIAEKTYSVLAPGADSGVIRHRDNPDVATEDAAGTTDDDPIDTDYCPGSDYDPCGILAPRDDSDDATGSFHEACLEDTTLTSALVDWQIVPVAGGPVAQSISEFDGPNGEPCVRWSAATTGTQSITASFDVDGGGVIPPIVFGWDGAEEGAECANALDDDGDGSVNDGCPVVGQVAETGSECANNVDDDDETQAGSLAAPQGPVSNFDGFINDGCPPVSAVPLIKEWNDIDETRIISATGNVGDTLGQNSGDLANWAARDCTNDGYCVAANFDGLTVDVGGVLLPGAGLIAAGNRSFIDYTFGSHADAGGVYDGPVDGAEQTYTISGSCGSARVEDPTTGLVHIISVDGPSSVTVLTSDKGVGFQLLPNSTGALTTTSGNADCGPNAEICITITTQEDNLFRSPPIDDAEDEEVCVRFIVGPPTNKTPVLAWAGQRVVVEADWADYSSGTRECPNYDNGIGDEEEFGVLYEKQSGPGSFTAELVGNTNDVDISVDLALVDVDMAAVDDNSDGRTDPNSDCISRIIFESQGEAQVDIVAFPSDDNDSLASADPRGQQQAFVIYYMKIEDVVLGLVPDADLGDHDYDAPSNLFGPIDSTTGASTREADGMIPGDVDEVTTNVSADVLARVRVRGWVETNATNCPARDSAVGSNGEFIPANRCIFPDDWRFKAGGALAEEFRPNFDTLGSTSVGIGCNSTNTGAAGPFSLLDRVAVQLNPLRLAPLIGNDPNAAVNSNVCGDSLAPHVTTAGQPCRSPNQVPNDCREVVFPNGVINALDAQMPPALIRLLLTGSGYIHTADKEDLYGGAGDLFYVTHIPAEPWISPINGDLSGYQWNTWGGPGGKSGLYDYWTSLADNGPEVVSCPTSASCGAAGDPGIFPCADNAPSAADSPDGCLTGGYKLIKIYSDNRGEAMAFVNGDADLDFSGCNDAADTPIAGSGGQADIVLISGYICPDDTVVGTSTLTAAADYPDKRKHFPVDSNDVTITWTWGGIKAVTLEPVAGNPQFNYVVFHVTDRDGFCSNSPSNHPVLGEQVNFMIDSPDGVITDAELNGAPLPASQGVIVTTTTFSADGNPTIARTKLVSSGDECQAWALVSASLLNPVNVLVTAYDPEGIITFDIVINEPTPTPTEEPTPVPTDTPAPPTVTLMWGDSDCDGAITSRDSQALLRRVLDQPELAQEDPCFGLGADITVVGANGHEWGDWDCDTGVTTRDSQAVLRDVLNQTPLSQEAGCPAMGASVEILV